MLFYTGWSEGGLTEKVTLELVRPGDGEGENHALCEKRIPQAEETANSKALK